MTIFPRSLSSHRSRRVALFGGSVLAVFAAAAVSAASLPNRLQANVSLSERTALPQGVSRRVTGATALGHLQGDTALSTMSLVLTPSATQAAALKTLLAQQQDPSSPNYHKWLTPTEFGARFGISDSDLQVLQNWLTSQGLQVLSVAPGRNLIQFSGRASVVESAFSTSFGRYQKNGQRFFENSTAPQIPAAFRGIVTGVTGLTSYRIGHHTVKHLNPQAASARPDYTGTDSSGNAVHYLTPYDVRQIYGASTLTSSGYNGTGVTIGIIGQSAVDTNQLALFQTLTGQTVKAPTLLLVPNSGTSTIYSGDESESESDLEYAGGVAPGANLVFIYSGSNSGADVFTALEYAIAQNSASILNFSYGGCELEFSTDALSIEPILQQANAQGQTILAASGDSGAASCEDTGATVAYNGLQVSYPASSPSITGVGGTTFNEGTGSYWATTNNSQAGSALSYIPEVAWDDTSSSGFSSSGGGASQLFSKPNWQTGTGVPADGARDVPDVAFAASPNHDGYRVCTSDTTFNETSAGVTYTGACTSSAFGSFSIGGTSLATPSFVGMLAAAVQATNSSALGNINQRLYSLASGSSASSVFHDITAGNNIVPCAAGTLNCTNQSLGYTAGTGYDQVTGLGSVDAAGFAGALTAATTATATVPTVTIVAASSTTTTSTYNITVSSADSTTVPTGTVNVSVDGGTATALTLTSGVAAFTLTNSSLAAGTHTITAAYAGDTNFAAASSSTTLIISTTTGALALNLTPSTITVTSGGTGVVNLGLTSTGYTGLVSYSVGTATGSASLSTGCFLGQDSVGIASGATVSTTVTYSRVASDCTTTGNRFKLAAKPSTKTAKLLPPSHPALPMPLVAISVAGCMIGGLFLRRRRTWAGGLLAVAFTATLLGLNGCGNSSTPITSTTPTPVTTVTGTYTITVTATSLSGSIVSSSNFTLVLQ